MGDDHSILVENEDEKILAEEVHLQESLEDSVGTEVPSDNIYEAPIECELCAKSTQHTCRIYNTQVCNLLCSIQDPYSSNEIYRIHKYGDSRCVGNTFDCPKCNNYFDTSNLL